MFIPISPNINWQFLNNWGHTCQLFRQIYSHIQLSAISSNMGLQHHYLQNSLVDGLAIFTMGLWASKVTTSDEDDSGYGIFPSPRSKANTIK
jgi:hypothetical protein